MTSALVIGGAAGVWHDLFEADKLFRPDMVIAVNDIGAMVARVDHWVTLHPERWPALNLARHGRGWSMDVERWSDKPPLNSAKTAVHVEPDFNPTGLSGLYAIKIARKLGADRIVLAGMPMDGSGHMTGDFRNHWINRRRRDGWSAQMPMLCDYVRSLSGWTQLMLGEPTKRWINERSRQHSNLAI